MKKPDTNSELIYYTRTFRRKTIPSSNNCISRSAVTDWITFSSQVWTSKVMNCATYYKEIIVHMNISHGNMISWYFATDIPSIQMTWMINFFRNIPPPPGRSLSFAALTIASASNVVMSPCQRYTLSHVFPAKNPNDVEHWQEMVLHHQQSPSSSSSNLHDNNTYSFKMSYQNFDELTDQNWTAEC